MDGTQLVLDGVKLMVMGMGMVYVFLVIMIMAMGIMRRILKPFAGALDAKPKAAAPAASGADDSRLAAIAAAAVELIRRK